MEEKKEEAKVEEEPEETECPKVDLTDEELKMFFKPVAVADISSGAMGAAFSQFAIPTKDEGFAEVKYDWQNEKASQEYLKKRVSGLKITARVDELKPSEWFKTKEGEFRKLVEEWQTKQKSFASKKKEKKPDGAGGEEETADAAAE